MERSVAYRARDPGSKRTSPHRRLRSAAAKSAGEAKLGAAGGCPALLSAVRTPALVILNPSVGYQHATCSGKMRVMKCSRRKTTSDSFTFDHRFSGQRLRESFRT